MSIRETYRAEITLDVQQLFELQKAIADRVVKYLKATDEEYPYRAEDIETLMSVVQLLDPHVSTIVDSHEDEVASKGAAMEKIRKAEQEEIGRASCRERV